MKADGGKPRITVAGAIIGDGAGRIFCALRSTSMSNPGRWEFPGGKIEVGESPAAALRRELAEEFGCDAEVDPEIFCDTLHEYPSAVVRLITLRCTAAAERLEPREHAACLWLAPEHLESLRWAEADIPAVRKLLAKARLRSSEGN